jgi:hypothetical protein
MEGCASRGQPPALGAPQSGTVPAPLRFCIVRTLTLGVLVFLWLSPAQRLGSCRRISLQAAGSTPQPICLWLVALGLRHGS